MSTLTILNEALTRGREQADTLAGRFENAYQKVFRAAMHSAAERFKQTAGSALLAATNPRWTPPDPDELVDEAAIAASLEETTVKLRRRALRAITEDATRDLEISFDITNPLAEPLDAQTPERAGQVTATVKQELARIIADGYERGLSVADTADAIWAAADPGTLTAAQSAALARTELNTIANRASLRLAKAAGAAEFKQWLTAADDRVRDMHVDAHGQTVPVDQPFSVGGDQMQYPGDPAGSPENTMNCRCTIVYTDTPPAIVAATEEGEPSMDAETAAVTVLVDEGEAGLAAGELGQLLAQVLADVATFAASAQGYAWTVQGSDYSEHRALFTAIYTDTVGSLDEFAEAIRQQGAQPPYGLDELVRIRSLPDGPQLESAYDMSLALRLDNGKIIALLNRAHAIASGRGEQGLAGILEERIAAHDRWDVQLGETLVAAAVTITVDDETEATAPVAAAGTAWVSDIAFEGVATADGRYILPDALDWREPPLTLMAMTETGPGGHEGAFVSGKMETFEKDAERDMEGQPLPEGVVAVRSRGIFDNGGEDGANVARLVDDEIVRGISVDLAVEEWLFRDPETGELLEPVDMDEAEWERAFFDELQFAIRKATILAATVCPTPAFDDARIAVTASGQKTVRIWAPLQVVPAELTASAAGLAPATPPREWFETPEADKPTPLTVTADGQVFGHMALWDSCHTGYPGQCVPPPRSPSGYSYFNLGEVECEDGTRVAAGAITLETLHADTARPVKADDARAHYENTGTVAAHVRAVDGKLGIWVAGALRAGLSEQHARDLMGAKPSGDWRRAGRGGPLEMIGVLAVNVPGYPVPRLVASALLPSGDRAEFAFTASLDDVDVRRRLEVLAASAAADPISELASLAGVSG